MAPKKDRIWSELRDIRDRELSEIKTTLEFIRNDTALIKTGLATHEERFKTVEAKHMQLEMQNTHMQKDMDDGHEVLQGQIQDVKKELKDINNKIFVALVSTVAYLAQLFFSWIPKKI